jgi:hypothetical protein
MIKLSVGLILINVDDFGNGGFEDDFGNDDIREVFDSLEIEGILGIELGFNSAKRGFFF